MRYTGTEYFKTFEEMMQCFESFLPYHVIQEALYNSIEISERIEDYSIFGSTRFPEMRLPKEFEGKADVSCSILVTLELLNVSLSVS
jgi:DNA polymerase-3 subunit alpha